MSRYLAAYQLGYIDQVWDPLFGDASRRVLDSAMSHLWPISDAGLGAIIYTLETLMIFMGGTARWRTMPWMVAFFGIFVIPLGLTHIVLVISQPVIVGDWCTLCLVAAALMLPMIPLSIDEVVAMAQHTVEAKRRGDRGGSLWRIFWMGGSADDAEEDDRTPELDTLVTHPARVIGAGLWGMSFPWPLLAATAIGLWTMLQPWTFGDEGWAAHVLELSGALIITTSVIAMGEPVRAFRFLNVPLGMIMVIGPWLAGAHAGSVIVAATLGVAVVGLSIPRGRQVERYGPWDRYVR